MRNLHIDGLVQERRNSSALAMELRLSCTNPSILPELSGHKQLSEGPGSSIYFTAYIEALSKQIMPSN